MWDKRHNRLPRLAIATCMHNNYCITPYSLYHNETYECSFGLVLVYNLWYQESMKKWGCACPALSICD